MLLKTKKKCTYFTIATFFFLGGVEYAVILPTVWLYLSKDFNTSYTMMGLVITAFQASGLILSPLMGWISDVTGRTKWLLLLSNLFEITGCIMYFMADSAWFLVASRFVSGIGPAVGGSIFADISRVTSVADRTGVFSLFMACRMFGLVVGPSFNLFLRKFDFDLGIYHINKYNAPGLFMAVIWILHEVQCVVLYWDLRIFRNMNTQVITESQINYTSESEGNPGESRVSSSYTESTRIDTNEYQVNPVDLQLPSETDAEVENLTQADNIFRQISSEHVLSSSSDMIESAERYMSPVHNHYAPPALSEIDSGSFHNISNVENHANLRSNGPINEPIQQENIQLWTWKFYYDEYIREEIVVILAAAFLSWFNQMCLETILTPLSKDLLGWDEVENSIFYFVAGIVIILGFILIRVLSRYVEDRKLLLFGIVLLTIETAILLCCSPNAKQNDQRNLIWLLTGSGFGLIALPFIFVTFPSLYSKLTLEETQGFSQGIRRVSYGLAGILGPLFAGSLLDSPTHQYVLFSVMTGLQILILVMLIISFHRLRVTAETTRSMNDLRPVNERSPLLRSS